MQRGLSCGVKFNETEAYIRVFDIYEEYDKPLGKVSSEIIGQGMECDVLKNAAYIGTTARDTTHYEASCDITASDDIRYILELDHEERNGNLQIIDDQSPVILDMECKDYERLINSFI